MTAPNQSHPIPGWRIVGSVSQAANADTYRVADTGGGRAFLKVFHPDRTAEHGFGLGGKLLEIAILESLQHPSIPTVIEAGVLEDGKRPYLLTELVPGETLDHRLRREFALNAASADLLMRELLGVTAYLHALDDPVVHNELVPSNVLLDAREDHTERPFLIDFGHARRISDGKPPHPSAIDPYYLPNECYEDGVGTPASDVFALGAIYFRTLFGMPPWDLRTAEPLRGDLREALRDARSKPLPVPARTLGGEIDIRTLAAIKKALSLRPEDRFGDAGAFFAALTQEAVVHRPVGGHQSAGRKDPIGRTRSAPLEPLKPVARQRRGFAAVGGMDDLKHTLTEKVIDPLCDPDRYSALGLGIPNGLLLYGPPGCGKTFIAERFGEELGYAFRKVTPADLASIYIHGTQEKIRHLFDEVRKEAPCVLFLDEVDAMIPSREHSIDHGYASEVNEWLAQMNECGRTGVFVLAASNQPEHIDTAALRRGRIDEIAYIGPPDHAGRKAIFEVHLTGRPRHPAIDCDELAHLAKGRVSSDIKFLVDEAAREVLRTGSDKIRMEHFRHAIRQNPPSVGAEELIRYERMRRNVEGSRAGEPPGRIGF